MDTKAVILAGRRDFGRCHLATQLPAMLWPIAGRAVIERLLDNLAGQGIRRATICFSDDDNATFISKSIKCPKNMEVTFLEEPLPLGTAGCVRDSICNKSLSQILVLHANMTSPPAMKELLEEHCNSKAEMTIVLNPVSDNGSVKYDQTAGIYICNPTILEHIPKIGYCDIKETLIPAILRVGKTVHLLRLHKPVGNYWDTFDFLQAVAEYLQNFNNQIGNHQTGKSHYNGNVWVASGAKVDPSARIYGPVNIMDDVVISKDVIIFGPSIIERNASVGAGSLIADSVIWSDANIGANCRLRQCLVEQKAIVPDGKTYTKRLIPAGEKTIFVALIDRASDAISKRLTNANSFFQEKLDSLNQKLPHSMHSVTFRKIFWISLVFIALAWSYWQTITDLWEIWTQSDEYSSGLLVPLLAVYIVWSRRDQFAKCQIQPSIWGLFAFIAAQAFRHFGLFFMYNSAERLSLVVSLAALVLFLYGWTVFRRALTILLFLGLMLPLPRSFEARITIPLQTLATSSAVFSLEMLGYEVTAEGNVIHLGQTTVAVAEACNGLRMVTSFFVISGLVILLVKRTWWEKLILLLSTLPIALFCNTVRLTITSIAFTILKGEYWEKVFHDYGGYAMMPLALAITVFELWILTRIITVPVDRKKEEIPVTSSKQ